MRHSSSLRALSVALALTVTATGCVSTAHGPSYAVSERGDASESFESDAEPGMDVLGLEGHPALGGLSPANRGGERVGLIIVLVLVLPIVVLVDLLTLPFAAPNGHAFHCTNTVFHHCTR